MCRSGRGWKLSFTERRKRKEEDERTAEGGTERKNREISLKIVEV